MIREWQFPVRRFVVQVADLGCGLPAKNPLRTIETQCAGRFSLSNFDEEKVACPRSTTRSHDSEGLASSKRMNESLIRRHVCAANDIAQATKKLTHLLF